MSTAPDRGEGGARQDKTPEEHVDYLLMSDALERSRSSMPRLNRIAVQRISDIEQYLACRYGRVLPEGDDAAAEDLVILLNHIAQNRVDPQAKMRGSVRCWAPWMDHDERRELVERIAKKPRRYRAKTLGRLMRVTEEEHARWGLRSIRAFTVTDADMKAKELHRERARKADKRRADGVVSREEYLAANSKSRTEPWKALNMSRPTYYRKLRAGEIPNETGPSAPLERDSYRADTPVSRRVSRMPIATIRADALDLDGIDFGKFGITGIQIMRGTDVVRAWVMR